ncbi:MAG: hypothetical protein MRERV_14c066 [Mycoplasmataceae bacterium RV_VA103A]|nr:MAG: hypothetical protein MRERV_14c066 [Mycoplasmataceae bacterium RV_VA103A]
MTRRGFPCSICKKWKEQRFAYTRCFNKKYGNRPCPDCGRISQRIVELVDNDNGFKRSFIGCLECNPAMKYVEYTDRVCADCYEEKNKILLNQQGRRMFGRIILPSVAGGLVIGFLLGWLFFKKLRKRKKRMGV